jgi:phosphohistidine phosphatase SixA
MLVALLRTSLTAEAGFLSLEGRQIVRAIGTRFKLNEDVSFDRVVTSTRAAAVQTAELLADRVDYVGVVETMGALDGAIPPEVLAPQILARGASVLVVGDEPALSTLGAFLVGRPSFPPPVPGQVSVIVDRQPAYAYRPGETGRSLLLVA